MTATPPIVELTDVVRQFGSGATAVRAIDGVSLAVAPGERIAVTGPSGAGKSTLLSLLGLIDRPDAGEVSLDGQLTNGLGEDARADLRREHIGFVFQLFHLIPALSAVENVAVPLLPYASRREILERAERLLADLGLGERLRNRPGELSGGEQQRVGIARALIGQPDLVFADEPTGNLDSRTAQQVIDLLLSLQERHKFALVVATHDASLATRLGRRVSLLDGRLLGGADAGG
jgi:predicted ABC-type transport system involved in lysophospholipase L1 biosynthesis ATPase subunit